MGVLAGICLASWDLHALASLAKLHFYVVEAEMEEIVLRARASRQ